MWWLCSSLVRWWLLAIRLGLLVLMGMVTFMEIEPWAGLHYLVALAHCLLMSPVLIAAMTVLSRRMSTADLLHGMAVFSCVIRYGGLGALCASCVVTAFRHLRSEIAGRLRALGLLVFFIGGGHLGVYWVMRSFLMLLGGPACSGTGGARWSGFAVRHARMRCVVVRMWRNAVNAACFPSDRYKMAYWFFVALLAGRWHAVFRVLFMRWRSMSCRVV